MRDYTHTASAPPGGMCVVSHINSSITTGTPSPPARFLCVTAINEGHLRSSGVIVCLASLTIFHCLWSPDHFPFDYYKLSSIMYLYDKKACDSSVTASKKISTLHFGNDSKGYDVLPYNWRLPIVTVSTRLSSSTRRYVKSSVILHCIWMTLSIILRCIFKHKKTNSNLNLMKNGISIYYWYFIIMVLFDLSMAVVYLSHIRQSLTRNMIIRYSGWSVYLQMENGEAFAGWLPMIAAVLWMRGFIILCLNLYLCRKLRRIKNRIRTTQFRKRYVRSWNEPIPEPDRTHDQEEAFFCMLISWLTLGCKLGPDPAELHEVTLIKLLYLYDPEACGRIHFYNFTTTITMSNAMVTTAVVWPVSNSIAAGFGSKIKVWLILHLLWSLLAIANNSTQTSRECAFYVTLLPLTITGVTLLVVDLVFAGLFLMDAKRTGSETAILQYINSNGGSVRSVTSKLHKPALAEDDTSWIAVLLAYSSIRGVVQWVFNFWIVKDCYFDGLASFHRIQNKLTSKSSHYIRPDD